MTFYVGQKVVCINDIPPLNHPRAHEAFDRSMNGLRKGMIYTVRETGLRAWMDGAPCIKLQEIIRPYADSPYWAARFRPVAERKTDISLFKKMLIPAPKGME